MDTASSMYKSWMQSSSFHLNDNKLIRNFLHISDAMLVFCLTNIHFVARFSSWWVVILWSLRWDRFPTWFLIPVHVIIYVARSLFSHTTPYTNIPLHAIPESLFPYLNIDQFHTTSAIVTKRVYRLSQYETKGQRNEKTCLVSETKEGILHRGKLNYFDIFERGEYGLELHI